MRRFILFLSAVSIVALTTNAQQIAVMNGAGATSVYYTLDDALNSIEDGSVVYIPGGAFKVKDETQISKRVTIMGIGHKPVSDNADGSTVISGNLNFAAGSDGSAIMGVYLTDNMNIAVGGKVNNILVKYCDANSIQVKSDSCYGIFVNQNYLRSNCSFANSSVTFTNNIVNGLININAGVVTNNIICGEAYGTGPYYNYHSYSYYRVKNSLVKNNISANGNSDCGGTTFQDNKETGDFNGLFMKYNGINTNSDFHFSDIYDGSAELGIYGGTGFSDDCLPPMPRIVSKNIAEQTDEQGKLRIQVVVKNK